uniref:Uncharacterized protein n=1 Tax=Candidatus Kentrum sp. TC TaxID=2126339 RepID=A0A450Y943_9GAMM|nr:MAG: hypothetical protein BECKTC1821D_GA0114238_100318 [Candidatus Kentron sp. TC]VFK54647.1 MAG: hypothetical protein BECKTC1821F_GA0114240_100588 [Candidatus Kentron sp. TC]
MVARERSSYLPSMRVTIHDYVDPALLMVERMYRKRKKGCRAMGYEIKERNR